MVTAEGFHNIGRELIPGNTYTLVTNNTSERNYGDAGGTTANIDNHIADRFFHIYTNTQCGGHWLMNHVNFFGTGLFGTVSNSPFFNFCD